MNWNPNEVALLVTLVAYHADTLGLNEHVTDQYRDIIFKAQDTATLVINENGSHSVITENNAITLVGR